MSANLDLGRNSAAFGPSGHVKRATDLRHEDDGNGDTFKVGIGFVF